MFMFRMLGGYMSRGKRKDRAIKRTTNPNLDFMFYKSGFETDDFKYTHFVVKVCNIKGVVSMSFKSKDDAYIYADKMSRNCKNTVITKSYLWTSEAEN